MGLNCGSNYRQIFSVNIVDPLYPLVSLPWIQLAMVVETVFCISGWEFLEVENQLSALFYTILYKGLGHPQILVFVGVWNQSPEVKSYIRAFIQEGLLPLTPKLFTGQ